MPDLVIAIARHGKSQTNQDHSLALEIPNHLIQLIEEGTKQALCAGQFIDSQFPDMKFLILSSPYERALHTAKIIKGVLGKRVLGIATTNSIREFYSGSEAGNDKTNAGHITNVYGITDDDQPIRNNPFYFQKFPNVGHDESPVDGECGYDVLNRTKEMQEFLVNFAIDRNPKHLAKLLKRDGEFTLPDAEYIGIILPSHSVAISALLDNLGLEKFTSMKERYRAENANPFFIKISASGKVSFMHEINQLVPKASRFLTG